MSGTKIINSAAALRRERRLERRERKLSRELMQACALVATRNQTIEKCDSALRAQNEVIREGRERERVLRGLLHTTGLAMIGAAADVKVIADVLRAHGAESAEARLRTLGAKLEERDRVIRETIASQADGCEMGAEERRS